MGMSLVSWRRLFEERKRIRTSKIQAERLANLGLFRYFDAVFYEANYHIPTREALAHYLERGWLDGLNPSKFFHTDFYLASNVDVCKVGMNPLIHYLTHGITERRSPHPAFDIKLFELHHPAEARGARDLAVLCLQKYDAYEWIVPDRPHWRSNALFDASWYIQSSPDLRISENEALAHYRILGWREGRDPNPLFDTDWYLQTYPDVAKSGWEPLSHYQARGHREGRRPNPLFDTAWYLGTYTDVLAAEYEPLQHFIETGEHEGRDPHLRYSTQWYKGHYPIALEFQWGPFAYYYRIGRARGDRPHQFFGDVLVVGPEELSRDFSISPPEPINRYASWLEVNSSHSIDRKQLTKKLEELNGRLPKVSVVMPAYESDPALLEIAINSVRNQLYRDWELCICDDASASDSVARILESYATLDSRIKWVKSSRNLNISGASNLAASLADGDIIALLDHDDELHLHALAEIAIVFAENPEVGIVYTDDDKIDLAGNRSSPQFKPDWSPTLLLSYMYISHLFSFRRSLFEEVGGFRPEFDGAQDFDLALRMSERIHAAAHIAKVLYHWRSTPLSTASSAGAKPAAIERGRRAVREALKRRGIQAEVYMPEFAVKSGIGQFDLRFPDHGPSASIIIPTKNGLDLMRNLMESLKKTTYQNFDVIIVDNGSDDQNALAYFDECEATVLRIPSPPEGFSFAHIVNAGVRAAKSEFVVLLNNDTEVRSPGWLSQMIGYSKMVGVGAVGARLLYGDGLVQHAGITHGLHEGMAGHSFKLRPEWDLGYLQLAKTTREVSGVTAACLLVRREVFLKIGGLDEVNFRVAYNDVDFCYRLIDAGYACIQCGSAELFHYEGKTRGFQDNPVEEAAMRRKYGRRRDPFYNPNLSLDDEQFNISRTHVPVYSGEPLRVALFSHNLNHEGAPNSLFELALGLMLKDIVPFVISPSDGPLRERYSARNIDVETVTHPWAGSPGPELFDIRLREFGQALSYAEVDVVIANTAQSFWAVRAAHLAGIPVIWIIRESEPWTTYFNAYPSYIREVAYNCFQYAYRVVFVAKATLDAWKPLDSRHSFALIRNGLNTEELKAAYRGLDREKGRRLLNANPEDCVFVLVGTVSERKGQIDLIRAFGALPHEFASQARVVIVGDRSGSYSKNLHSAVAGLAETYRNRVMIVDETSEAKTYLTGADVAVCTSRIESYPRVTLEAMAAGLPLLTTGVWGIREQVRPNYNALIYEPGDVQQMAAHMIEFIQNPGIRKLMGRRATFVFDSLPNFEFMRDRYRELIHQAQGSL